MVSCNLSPKSLLGIYALGYIRATAAIIFCDSLLSVLFLNVLSIFFNLYARVLVFFCFSELFFESIQFWIICYEMILWSTSEAHIWFLIITFITFIIRFAWIEGWFIIVLYLYLLLKWFFSWTWTPTVTEPWLRQISLSLFITEFSKFKESICKSDIDNGF